MTVTQTVFQDGFTQLLQNVSKASKATGHRVRSGSQREHLFGKYLAG